MADTPYSFEIDARHRLLKVTTCGYWDMACCEAYIAAFQNALRKMRAGGGCRYCLVDAADFAVQSREVSEALHRLVQSLEPGNPQRMAGIAGSQLSRIQASRQGTADNVQIFCSRAQAETWLFADAA